MIVVSAFFLIKFYKMRAIIVLALSIAAVGAAPKSTERIVGGITTTVDRYPYIAALLVTLDDSVFHQFCGGSIINLRSILTAAHCTNDLTPRLRMRLGSTFSTSGGVVYVAETIFNHAGYDMNIWSTNMDNDISIIRTTTFITYVDNLIRPAQFAGINYPISDNDVIWAAGWGHTSFQGSASEELRHAQTWVINQEVCADRYNTQTINYAVTANMICTGWLDMGGRGQCSGDSGGPVVHNGVIVGITSWSFECALGQYPTVSTRVSRYVEWIQARA